MVSEGKNQRFTPPSTHVPRSGGNTLNYSDRSYCPEILHGDKSSERRTCVREIPWFQLIFNAFSDRHGRLPLPLKHSQICDARGLVNIFVILYEPIFTSMRLTTYEHVQVIQHCAVYSIGSSLFWNFLRGSENEAWHRDASTWQVACLSSGRTEDCASKRPLYMFSTWVSVKLSIILSSFVWILQRKDDSWTGINSGLITTILNQNFTPFTDF